MCIILLSLFSCVTTKEMNKKYTNVRLEMTLIDGKVVTEEHLVPADHSIFIRTNNNKSWLVSKLNNCDDCIPTILKNNKVIVRDHKVIVKNHKVKVRHNKAIVGQY
jgi:hypothetical protein